MYGPYNLHVAKDKVYKWCSCGLSKTQPWCDGAHKGTPFKPLRFSVSDEVRFRSLCGCKYTAMPPYCDGSHALMPADPAHPPCRCPDW